MSSAVPTRQSSAPTKRSTPTPAQSDTPIVKTKQPGALSRIMRRVKSAFGIRTGARVVPTDCAPSAPTPVELAASTPIGFVVPPISVSASAPELVSCQPATAISAHSESSASIQPVEVASVDASPARSSAPTDDITSPDDRPISSLRLRARGVVLAPVERSGTPEKFQRPSPTKAGVTAVVQDGGSPSHQRAAKVEYPEFMEELRETFGAEVVAELKSDKWTDRQAMLKRLAVSLASGAAAETCVLKTVEDRLKVCRVLCGLVRTCFDDKVAPVVFGGFELWWAFVTSDVVAEPSTDASVTLGTVIPGMLHKMTEKNARTSREAMKCILALARNRAINGFDIVAPFLIEPSLPVMPRLELLKAVLQEFKIKKGSCLNIGSVMGVAVPALHIADDATRKVAIDVVVAGYKYGGHRLLPHLKDVKPVLLKILHRKFAEVDERSGGAPTAAAVPAATASTKASRADAENAGTLARGAGKLPTLSGSTRGAAYLPSLALPTVAPVMDKAPLRPSMTAAYPGQANAMLRSRMFDAHEEELMNSIAGQF